MLNPYMTIQSFCLTIQIVEEKLVYMDGITFSHAKLFGALIIHHITSDQTPWKILLGPHLKT